MTENELYHFGIKGMHWGVRRFQNEDGTLTDAGKAHAAKIDKAFTAGKDGKASPAEKMGGHVEKINENAKKIVNKVGKNKSDDPSGLSDAELRSRIQRIQMENQYKALTEVEPKWKTRTKDILDTTGSVLAIGTAVVGIAAGIHTLRKG